MSTRGAIISQGERPSPAAEVLSRSGVVPLLRGDLVVGRGASPGLFELSRQGADRRLVLYEFELSVARMLDGRRQVAEVLENAERLGIPVDPEGLTRFVQLLRHNDFLAPAGSKPPAGSGGPWEKRKPWDSRTRSRFQEGVRLVRQGKPDEAVASFRAILATDAENPEAHEMLALIAAGHALAARPIGEVFQRPARLARQAGPGRWVVASAVALFLLGAGAVAWWLVAPGGNRRASVASSSEAGSKGRSRRGGPPVAPAVEVRAEPAPVTPAAAPVPPEPPVPAPRAIPIDRRWHPTVAEVRSPAAGILAWAEPALVRAGQGERIGEVRSAKAQGAPGPGGRKRLEELERLAAADAVYQEFLEKERAAVEGERAVGRAFGIVAPKAGQVTPVVRGEARVASGELVARIVDAESWQVSLLLHSDPPEAGTACELAGDGAADRAACQVVESRPANGHFVVTLSVVAGAVPWLEQARAPYARLDRPAVPLARKERP